MPTPTMVIVATWVRFTRIVCHVRKLSVKMALKSTSTSRARSAPWVCPMVRSQSGNPDDRDLDGTAAASVLPASAMNRFHGRRFPWTMGHGGNQGVLFDLVMRKLGNRPTITEDGDPIAALDDLLGLR